MNNAAFFYNTFERTKSKKNPTAKKVAKPKQAAKSPNATKQKKTKLQKRRRDEKRQLSRLFPATKSPFKGFHNFSKRILSCCSSIFNSKFS